MIGEPCPVVLYFPDHSLLSPSQDQHGHSVPSTSAIAPRVASAASSAVGLNSAVAWSISGVSSVMYREIVAWCRPNISAQTSSVILLRPYPQGDYKRLAERQFPRPTEPLIPWFSQQFLYAFFQFAELLAGQA
jgi:hypothetical protein